MMIRCQSVRSLAFLQAEWIPMLTDISISRPQPAGTRPSTRSPPMTGRSEWRPSDPMVILFRVPTCHMHKQAYSGAVVEIAQDWVRNITDALIYTTSGWELYYYYYYYWYVNLMLVLFESDITVLLALSFYQILVSDSLPASSESVPVVGQSAVLIRCGFITVVTLTSCYSIGSHRPHRECWLVGWSRI